MEEVKRSDKDYGTLTFVVILIIIGIIGCFLAFLSAPDSLKRVFKTPVEDSVLSDLKNILGTNITDCYNNSFNYALNQNAEAFFNDDYKGLDYANIMFKSAIEKNLTGLTSNENCGGEEGICYFISNENYIKIKNQFELKTQVPNPKYYDDDFVYILYNNQNDCKTKVTHDISAYYKNSKKNEIIFTDKINVTSLKGEKRSHSTYNYTFKVNKDGYVLTNIEK